MMHAYSQPRRVARKAGVAVSSYAVFWSVALQEGRTQVEIAEETGLSTRTVSRVIANLGGMRNGLGWIRQVTDDDDRRVRRLFLSAKGRSLHTRMLKDLRKPLMD